MERVHEKKIWFTGLFLAALSMAVALTGCGGSD